LYETPKRALRSEPFALPSNSSDVIYETTTLPIEIGDDDDDEEDVGTEDHQISPQVLAFGAAKLRELASPYVSLYWYKKFFLDTVYGIAR
jgi:hypothetical protein